LPDNAANYLKCKNYICFFYFGIIIDSFDYQRPLGCLRSDPAVKSIFILKCLLGYESIREDRTYMSKPESITLEHLALINKYITVRQKTLDLCVPLEIEDMVVQPASFVSPPKWHLAHTTWFFVTFVFHRFGVDYAWPDKYFPQLFNSYYKSQGQHWVQGDRGNLSRPTVKQIQTLRQEVDEVMISWLERFNGDIPSEIQTVVRLGLEHEQQHQELLMMDIKYILWCNPSKPAYLPSTSIHRGSVLSNPGQKAYENENWSSDGGLQQFGVGLPSADFCFDNETPQHNAYLQPYSIAHRTVSNAEFSEFIADGGYQEPSFWLSEGWDYIQKDNINAPLYWRSEEGDGKDRWQEYTLNGMEEVRGDVPVSHISFHEAYAYARWANKRLPTEFEWEHFAKHNPSCKSASIRETTELFLENNLAQAYYPEHAEGFVNVNGGLWEWTSSTYAPYPGYRSEKGAFGEYNGKFMINQVVLRGGCFATPRAHYRMSYRNFYQAHQRWAFTGLRLVEEKV